MYVFPTFQKCIERRLGKTENDLKNWIKSNTTTKSPTLKKDSSNKTYLEKWLNGEYIQ
jgi:hypothetical protein